MGTGFFFRTQTDSLEEGDEIQERYRERPREILSFLAPRLRKIVEKLTEDWWANLEEIRLRTGKPLQISGSRLAFLASDGVVSTDPQAGYVVTEDDIYRTIQLMGGNSLYTLEAELREGFITIPGGHRIGLSGECLSADGRLLRVRKITSLNIRLAKELIGIAHNLMPYLYTKDRLLRTLILSPPQAGKTTLLRDIIRTLSNGEGIGRPIKVGLVDERNEISGAFHGIPQLDIGVSTDLLCGCPKKDGVFLLLRSMGPQVIAMDEIGRPGDIEFVEEILNSGVGFISTAHAWSTQDLAVRPGLRRIWRQALVERVVILSRRLGTGTLEGIWDGQSKKPLCTEAFRLEVKAV